MEDEVDEGLEEEDAMAVGPLRGGDERGGREREVWFGVCLGSSESPLSTGCLYSSLRPSAVVSGAKRKELGPTTSLGVTPERLQWVDITRHHFGTH